MISGFAHMDMGGPALEFYARMQSEGFSPDDRTLVAALKACSSLAVQAEGRGANAHLLKTSCLYQGRDLHAEIRKRGFESAIFIASTLVDMYSKCGSIEEALQVFQKMRHRNEVSWNAMIIGYAQMEMGASALELYARMRHEGFQPDSHTFVAALKACASLAAQEDDNAFDGGLPLKKSSLEQGIAIHAEISEKGFKSDIFVASALIDMYVKCRSIQDATQVFKKMRKRDVVSWTAMIMGFAQMDMGAWALELYECMRSEGFTPGARTYVAALTAYASLAAQEEGKGADVKLLKQNYLEQGRAIHSEVTKRGFESDIFVANSLMDMYTKCGSIQDAWQVFEKMKHKDVVSWTTMITGYALMEMGDLALELYERMQNEGFTPNTCTFIAALRACGSLASLEAGKEIHSQIHRAGLQGESFIANCLVDMYCKCGSMWDAQQFFDSLPRRDSVTWNALIAGYSGQGDSECVFNMYKVMQQEGVKPDEITFVSVLSVCSNNGLVDKGHIYFQNMCLEYGIFPSRNHYTCMTDLFGRAGQLDEAIAIMMKMQFEPHVDTWMTILGACRKWNNVETGRTIFECAVTLDEKIAATYVLMNNIFISSQMWVEIGINENKSWSLA